MKQETPKVYYYEKAIKIPLYYGSFLIIFSNDGERVKRTTNIRGELNDFAFTFYNFIHKGKETFCVCFNFWTLEPVTMGTITHEVNHAANRVLYSRGVVADYENDEADSYLKGWMVEQVQRFMQDCNIEISSL